MMTGDEVVLAGPSVSKATPAESDDPVDPDATTTKTETPDGAIRYGIESIFG